MINITSAQFKETDSSHDRYRKFEVHFRPDFDVVDINKDGLISKKEIRALSPKITDMELIEYISRSDTNDDGYISFKEFVLAGIDLYDSYYAEQEDKSDEKPVANKVNKANKASNDL